MNKSEVFTVDLITNLKLLQLLSDRILGDYGDLNAIKFQVNTSDVEGVYNVELMPKYHLPNHLRDQYTNLLDEFATKLRDLTVEHIQQLNELPQKIKLT